MKTENHVAVSTKENANTEAQNGYLITQEIIIEKRQTVDRENFTVTPPKHV